MSQPVSLYRVALIGGVVAAVLCFLYFFALGQAGLNPFGRFKYLYIGLYGVIMAASMYTFRTGRQHKLSGQQGILLGLLLNAVAAILHSAMLYTWFKLPNGRHIVRLYTQEALHLLEGAKEHIVETLGEASYQQAFEQVGRLTPSDLAFDQLIGMSMVGLFLTFLFMLIFKRS